MKFTLSWLKKHLETDASAEEIAQALTSAGLEVESLSDPARTFAPFKVAYVESAEKHPDADKLKVCKVKTESGVLQVVCGAPNARTGMKGIFAPEGSYIPGTDLTLKKGVIRGVESCGMLVSEKEMGLSDEHKGIIEVDEKYEIGTPMAKVFNLDDPVFEISLTPNRIDCAGVRGIARDLAAAGLGTLKKIDDSRIKGQFKSPINVTIEDKDGCPLFLGRYIQGVKNGPSPAWLQNLLKSVGLRPISALVDITNLMTVEYCRPLHVFDADKIQGHIKVRKTVAGEKLTALNDKTYDLIEGAVGICDDSGLQGIGGIVGGVPTGCTDETTNVFVEAAYFNPMRIAKAGRALQIDSDARYRFERGIDPEFTITGIEIATRLILELCGGTVSDIVQAGDMPKWQRTIDLDPAYVQKLSGVEVDEKTQKERLTTLGFDVSGKNPFKVQPPSWRGDVEGKADLVEEIVRIGGYDKIPAVSVRREITDTASVETPTLSRARMARTAMTARGMDECVTWSFMNKERARHFNDNQSIDALTLSNPISADLDQMRPSILPNLIEAAGRNSDRGFSDVALCEIGPSFQSPKPEGQAIVAAGIRAGSAGPRHWSGRETSRAVDAFDAKADAMAVLNACGAPNVQISRDVPSYYHPGRSGSLKLGNNVLAYFGEIHPAVLDEMKIDIPVAGFEVFIQNIPETRKKGTNKPMVKLSAFQPVRRDFAFIVDQTVTTEDVVRTAKAADKNLIQDIDVFDVYAGKGIDPGKKSVAIAVTIQPVEKTLTDAELEGLSKKIVDAVIKKTGGSLRS